MFFLLFQILARLTAAQAITTPGVILVQTDAVCSKNFTWAQNSKSQSPCLVAAYIGGACGSDGYTVQALPSGEKYNAPALKNNTVNVCTCSWAMYNLISACTACQNQNASILSWTDYDFDCAGFLTGPSYFPLNISLTSATSIPFWATQDPTGWSNGRFNLTTAEQIVEEGHSDVNPSVPLTKSKTPIGPIIGGAVGGASATILAAGAITCMIIRKRRATRQQRREGFEDDRLSTRPNMHGRSISEISHKSFGGMSGHGDAGQAASMSPGHHEHSASIQSLPYNSVASRSTPTGSYSPPTMTQMIRQQDVIEPYIGIHPTPAVSRKGMTPSMQLNYDIPPTLPPGQGLNSYIADREDIIEPFVGVQSSTNPVARKGTAPVNSAPSVPPPAMTDDPPSFTETNIPRPRLNPPAYTPSPEMLSSSLPGSPEPRMQGLSQGDDTILYRHRVTRGDQVANSVDLQSSWSRGSITASGGVIGHMRLGSMGELNLGRAGSTDPSTQASRGSTIYTTAPDVKAGQSG